MCTQRMDVMCNFPENLWLLFVILLRSGVSSSVLRHMWLYVSLAPPAERLTGLHTPE